MVRHGLDLARGALSGGPNGSTPRCDHLDEREPAPPDSAECRECTAAGTAWSALVVCLTCGWVACSDDSPERHARAHYEETNHPVVRALRQGPERHWCYIHRRSV